MFGIFTRAVMVEWSEFKDTFLLTFQQKRLSYVSPRFTKIS